MKLIDPDALIANKFKNDISYNAFVSLVRRQPAIDIIHCRDCENCEITVPISHPDTTLYECQLWKYDRDGGYLVKPDGYCYKGVRREPDDV